MCFALAESYTIEQVVDSDSRRRREVGLSKNAVKLISLASLITMPVESLGSTSKFILPSPARTVSAFVRRNWLFSACASAVTSMLTVIVTSCGRHLHTPEIADDCG